MSSLSSVTYQLEPGGRPSGVVRVPGDKSISHRSVMLGALAEGITEVSGFLTGEDCLCTMKAFRAMGVRIEQPEPTRLTIHGVGLHGLRGPATALDLGNSGTSMRLMAGLMAGQRFSTTLVGDASLSRRPMKRIIAPLEQMGARIDSSDGRAPLRIQPVPSLKAISYRSPVASAQVKSGVLLAGLYAQGRTEIYEPGASRDHTERMLRAFGAEVAAHEGYAALDGGQTLRGTRIEVPADISSAAFFLVAAAITPGAELLLTDVGINPTRTGIVEVLRRMGAEIHVENERQFGAEPVADLRVRGGPLSGIEIGRELVAASIDEFPIIFVAAACARGETLVTGAEELRVKESDRIATTVQALNALGGSAEALEHGLVVHGPCPLQGGEGDSRGDHRLAALLGVAGLLSAHGVSVEGAEAVSVSYPSFWQDLRALAG